MSAMDPIADRHSPFANYRSCRTIPDGNQMIIDVNLRDYTENS